MITIGDSINNFKNENKKMFRFYNEISPENFKAMFLKYGNEEVKKQNDLNEFTVDYRNKDVINQLYFYLVGDKQFRGDLNKGIILIGGFGTGKTTIINVFGKVYCKLNNLIMRFVSAVELIEMIKTNPEISPDRHISRIENIPLIIDEIGRESQRVLVYGTEHYPLQELLTMRYNSKGYTLGTSNMKYETLNGMYGEYIGERMKEMFNFIELNGESRRK